MPNYNKSFNFRNGVQVDEDNFYINANGLVGIGTTIPRYTFDLYGDASISGLTTTKSLGVTGVATFGQVSLGQSIVMTAETGIITAYKFYGDGSALSNIPTSQWIDVDPSAAFVSIYSKGAVGVGTTNPTLPYILTIGQNPDTVDINVIPSGGVGFSSYGCINASGIITAVQFSGSGGAISNLNASNISSGTLSNDRLPSQINLSTGIATIRNVVVSSGATIAGVTTFNSQGLTSKNITATAFTGGSVYASSIVEIASTGLLRFSGGSGIYIGNNSGTAGQFLVSNGSNGLAWSSDISLSGILTVGSLRSQNIFNTGITTTSQLQVDTTATINNLTVTRITSSNTVATNEITRINSGIVTTTILKASSSETGVTTSTSLNTGNLNATGIGTLSKLYSGNVRLNETTNTLETVSGDLKLGASSSVINVNNNLNVDGQTYLVGLTTVATGLVPDEDNGAYLGSSTKKFSEAYIDNIRIGVTASNKIDTITGNLLLEATGGTVDVQSNLNTGQRLTVSGSSYLTGIATVATGLVPNVNDGAYLGAADRRFSEAHIDDVRIGSTASNKIDSRSGNLLLDSASGTVNIQDNLDVDEALNVDGQTYLSGIATVATGLVPDEDDGAYLGTSDKRFSEAHIDNLRLGVSASNVLDTRSGNLVLNSTGGTVEVDDKLDVNETLNVDGQTYLVGLATVATGLVPDEDDGAYLGTASKRFSEAYIDELQIGVLNSSGIISTRTSNLTLDSFSGRVVVINDLVANRNLNVTGVATVSNTLTLGSSLLPSLNTNSNIGSASLRFAEAHIDDIRIGVSGVNQIDTRSGNLVLNSTGGTVEVDDKLDVNETLNVDGQTYLSGITTTAAGLFPNQSNEAPLGSSTKRFTEAHIDDIRIGVTGVNQIDTRTGNLVLNSTGGTVEVDDKLDVNQTLNVDGQTYLSGITTVADNLLPSTDGGSSLGQSNKSFASLHVANLNFGVSSNQINTRTGNLNLSSINSLVNIQDNLNVNGRLYVAGISTFADVCQVDVAILPDTNLGAYLGSGTTAFANAHIGNINISDTEDNTISTKSGDLKLTSNTNIVRALNNLSVDGRTELTGITSVGTGLIPVTDRSAYLGLQNDAFNYAYINNIRVAVANTSTIDTISGNLILQSAGDTVSINDNLNVDGNLTVRDNVFAGTLFVNNSNNRIGFGTTAPTTQVELTTDDENASILIRSLDPIYSSSLSLRSGSNIANIEFNVSNDKNLLIKNQTVGSIIHQLHSSGSGINTGNHVWKYKDDELMTLTYAGKLGIGDADPIETFGVVGTSTVSSNSFVGGDLNVVGDFNLLGDFNYVFPESQNFKVGIITCNTLNGLTSITTQQDIFVKGIANLNEISSPVGTAITIYSNTDFYGVTTFRGPIVARNDITSVTNRSIKIYQSQPGGVGAVATITSQKLTIGEINTESIIGTRVESTFTDTSSLLVGIATIGTLVLSGAATTTTFTNVDVTGTLNAVNGGPVYIGGSVTPAPYEYFLGIGTDRKFPGTNLLVNSTLLSPNIIVGFNTLPSSNEFLNGGLALLNRGLYGDNATFNLRNGSQIKFDDQTTGRPSGITDAYGKVALGIGTDDPKAIIDFRYAGSGLTINSENTLDGAKVKFMVPPLVTASERVGLTTIAGAIIYNTTTNRHQGYNGTDWFDLY